MGITIYILELTQNKYYVGKTSNTIKRILEHFNNNGSEWTKKYKPIKVLEKHNGDGYNEKKYTLKTMNEYGIDNVRGGPYCKIKLTDSERKTIEHSIKSANDECYICGSKDHFAYDCNEIKLSDGNCNDEENSDEEDSAYHCIHCGPSGYFEGMKCWFCWCSHCNLRFDRCECY